MFNDAHLGLDVWLCDGKLPIAGSKHLSFLLSMRRSLVHGRASNNYIVDVSPHCTFVHVAQDNSYLRDLINLESATLSKTIFVVH